MKLLLLILKTKELKDSSSKRAEDELKQESAKKQKVDDDQEASELKRCLEIVPNDEDDVIIDATALSSKSQTIVDYKIHKEGEKVISKSSRQMMYPLTRNILHQMWNNARLQFDYEVEMAYDLLRLVKR
nr:hypothetical protein [Tanacetum cinerariifolium]